MKDNLRSNKYLLEKILEKSNKKTAKSRQAFNEW